MKPHTACAGSVRPTRRGASAVSAVAAAVVAAVLQTLAAAGPAHAKDAASPAASKAAKSAPRAAAPPAHCAGKKGLALEVCRQCELPGKSNTARFLCREGTAAKYCAKNILKNDPDCQGEPNTSRQNL